MQSLAGRVFLFQLFLVIFFFLQNSTRWEEERTGPVNFVIWIVLVSTRSSGHVKPERTQKTQKTFFFIGLIECCRRSAYQQLFSDCTMWFTILWFIQCFTEYRYRCEQEAKSIWKKQSVSMKLMWGKFGCKRNENMFSAIELVVRF